MENTPKKTIKIFSKNINKRDRIIRLVIGLGLLALAYKMNWNPLVIFLAAFCIFEATFSWCGYYALIGKNTCPVE